MKLLNIKNSKLKVFAAIVLAVVVAIPSILSSASELNAVESTVYADPSYDVAPSHGVERNDGNAGYGSHVYPEYIEDGVKYFRDGDIVQVSIYLPAGHGSAMFQDVVKFDDTKLTLLSSYREIMTTSDSSYYDSNWEIDASSWQQDLTQIIIFGGGQNPGFDFDYTGGCIARIYFRVKNGVETEAGTGITFTFPAFQSVARVNNRFVYNHRGYDADRDAETAYLESPAVTIVAKKPAAAELPGPTLSLKGQTAEIFEGDLFNPTDYITEVSDANDPNVNKSSVVIEDENGKPATKQQLTAGTYTYKYKVTNVKGKTTEKEMTLTVTPRTYTVKSVDSDAKKIELPIGVSDAEFTEKVEALKNEDLDVTIACNDGTLFTAPGKVLDGVIDEYVLDEAGNLTQQEFNIAITVGLPFISYDTEGNRVVTPHDKTRFLSNVGSGTVNVNVPVVIGANPTITEPVVPTNPGTGTGNGNNVSKVPTNDTTNAAFFALLMILSAAVVIRLKSKKNSKA